MFQFAYDAGRETMCFHKKSLQRFIKITSKYAITEIDGSNFLTFLYHSDETVIMSC